MDNYGFDVRGKDMNYIIVRTYGNGKYMNKVYPMMFEWLSQAEKICSKLNKTDCSYDEKWIAMPVTLYVGDVW